MDWIGFADLEYFVIMYPLWPRAECYTEIILNKIPVRDFIKRNLYT
jgi:hypothetical protein